MKAVHFGAGNIGRGFVGLLLHEGGYDLVFSDVAAPLVDAINAASSYTVHEVGEGGVDKKVTGFRAINSATDPEALVAEIGAALAATPAPGEGWNEAPLDELVRHLLTAYHAPLREELPRLEAMVRKVASVHGEREPVRLPALQAAFLALEADLTQHMDSEEAELFPPILERGAAAAPEVASFRDDHTEVGRLLGEIRALTDDFRLPDGACNTWSALWHGLEALETDLHHHIHLENNVLFPRLAAA